MRRLIDSTALTSDGALTFDAMVRGEVRHCFAVRTAHGVRGFVNVCAHRNQPVLVDDRPYDDAGRLECRAHGALYEPETGLCVGGPCVGGRLLSVGLVEHDGALWVVDDDAVDDSVYADEEG